MKIIRKPVLTMTLEEFAEEHDLTLEVVERGIDFRDTDARYYADFVGCEVKKNGILLSEFGDGATEEGAIANYASVISGKTLVLGAFTPERREIQVPILVFTTQAEFIQATSTPCYSSGSDYLKTLGR